MMPVAEAPVEYWIDGYNLILRKRWNASMTLQQCRDKLLSSVAALGVPVRVFFDASKPGAGGVRGDATPSTLVTPVFVRDRSADDAMADLLRSARKGSVTVVTDDRELRGRVRQLGANALGVSKFLERLEKKASPVVRPGTRGAPVEPGEKPSHISRKQVQEWMDWFGFDEDDDLLGDDPR